MVHQVDRSFAWSSPGSNSSCAFLKPPGAEITWLRRRCYEGGYPSRLIARYLDVSMRRLVDQVGEMLYGHTEPAAARVSHSDAPHNETRAAQAKSTTVDVETRTPRPAVKGSLHVVAYSCIVLLLSVWPRTLVSYTRSMQPSHFRGRRQPDDAMQKKRQQMSCVEPRK